MKHRALSFLAIIVIAYISGCVPSLESSEPRIRQHAVRELTDQAKLAEVALNDSDTHVRVAAMMKLTDQTLLAKVAIESNDRVVRISATQKLTDQKLLADVAVQTVLAKIAMEDANTKVRLAAVKKITDQSMLVKIAADSRDLPVALAALDKVTDQTLLAQTAAENADLSVALAALQKVNVPDQTLLAKVATKGTDLPAVLVEIEKLTDLALIRKFALVDSDGFVRQAAIKILPKLAVKNGDLEIVKELLAGNPGLVRSKDDESTTLLHIAAFNHQRVIAELLLTDGAEVDARDKSNVTPLMAAAVTPGGADVMKLLLAKGADVNAKTQGGVTALLMAVTNRELIVAKVLLDHKADVNVQVNGRTLLSVVKQAAENSVDIETITTVNGFPMGTTHTHYRRDFENMAALLLQYGGHE